MHGLTHGMPDASDVGSVGAQLDDADAATSRVEYSIEGRAHRRGARVRCLGRPAPCSEVDAVRRPEDALVGVGELLGALLEQPEDRTAIVVDDDER